MDQALRWAFGNTLPFGGITCLFFGDYSQIPPVGDLSITRKPDLLNGFQIMELTEGVRQKNDVRFLTALNNFAEGK